MTLFWIAFGFFAFVFVANLYNARVRIAITNMVKWLEEQVVVIKEHDDYKSDVDQLKDTDIPQAKQYLTNTIQYYSILQAVQTINAGWLFMNLLTGGSYILNGIAACGNAYIVVLLIGVFKRRYIVEGMCRGTQIIIESLDHKDPDTREE